MYAMVTCYRGTGHQLERGIDLHTEDPEATDIDN